MDSIESQLIEKYRGEQEKGDYLFHRLAVGYARVYAFRQSLLGKALGFLERAIAILTFRASSKSELTQIYEAALDFQQRHKICLKEVLREQTKAADH